jgi:hypothetical protein
MYPKNQNKISYDMSQSREFSRLLTAAVVNQEFCHLLLTDPMHALSSGYNGETFEFTSDAQALILSIQANSLNEFATQLVAHRKNSNGNGNNGNGHKFKDTSIEIYSARQPIPGNVRELNEVVSPGV